MACCSVLAANQDGITITRTQFLTAPNAYTKAMKWHRAQLFFDYWNKVGAVKNKQKRNDVGRRSFKKAMREDPGRSSLITFKSTCSANKRVPCSDCTHTLFKKITQYQYRKVHVAIKSPWNYTSPVTRSKKKKKSGPATPSHLQKSSRTIRSLLTSLSWLSSAGVTGLQNLIREGLIKLNLPAFSDWRYWKVSARLIVTDAKQHTLRLTIAKSSTSTKNNKKRTAIKL